MINEDDMIEDGKMERDAFILYENALRRQYYQDQVTDIFGRVSAEELAAISRFSIIAENKQIALMDALQNFTKRPDPAIQ